MKTSITNSGILVVKLQRGAAFTLNCAGEDSAGDPIDYSTFTFKGEVRNKLDELIDTFTFDTSESATGKIKVICDDTSAWPIEDLYFDVYINEIKDWLIERSVCRVNDAATEVV